MKVMFHIIMLFLLFFYSCIADSKSRTSAWEKQLLFSYLAPATMTVNEQLPVTPYDSMNGQLKTDIISYLKSVETQSPDACIIGQNVGHADWSESYHYAQYWDDIYLLTGKKPGIMAADLGFGDYSGDYSILLADIEEHWNNGGLISLSLHMPNPKTLKGVYDKNFNSSDYASIFEDSSQIRKKWLGMLNNVANILQILKQKNIIILWRPLHEMNGGWFWWGNDLHTPTDQQFINLWKDMHDYLYITRQLDNLLWVYSPNYKYDSPLHDTDYYYPGNSYADIVGLDYYNDSMADLDAYASYTRLADLGKPMAICEIGPETIHDGSFDNRNYLQVVSLYPKCSYMVTWYSWPGYDMAIQNNRYATEFMNETRIITLDDVSY
jgi:mannan endo-1,4-beta-mannosidase